MITPLLDRLKTQGGTLYTFSGASRDLTRIFTSNLYDFRFSHFACLNLPNFKNGKFENGMDKGMYLETFKDIVEWNGDNMNISLAEHLQNYVMNFESVILNYGDGGDVDVYNPDELRTPTERIFFNWLRKIGGISFNDYKESDYSFSDRTIQYIGNIDVINSVDINGDSFDEVYLYIPSNCGGSDNVQFRKIEDENYSNSKYIVNGEKIVGRDGMIHPYSLDLNAFYDNDQGNNVYSGDEGYVIDFRESSYLGGINGMNVSSTENFEFNCILIYYDLVDKGKRNDLDTYSYATNLYGVLFLEEITDIKIDNIIDDTISKGVDMGYIQRYPKIKGGDSGNGNSYGLKVDLKIDTIPDSTMKAEPYLDPNNLPAMEMFLGYMNRFGKCIDIFDKQQKLVYSLQNSILDLKNQIGTVEDINSIKSDIDIIYKRFDDNSLVNTSTMVSMITENTLQLQSILEGKLSKKLQYNTDVIKSGDGIDIIKDNDYIYINNSIPSYNIVDLYKDKEYTLSSIISPDNLFETTITKSSEKTVCYCRLKYGPNLSILYIHGFDNIFQCNSDIVIYIDDKEIKWKKGQSFKIVIDGYLIMSKLYGTSNLYPKFIIRTGYNEEKNDYMQEIRIEHNEISEKKSIEIICIDDVLLSTNNKKFIYEIR